MSYINKPIIKLLIVLIFLFLSIFSFFKFKEIKFEKSKVQRNYPSSVYEQASSFSHYFIHAEYELKDKRNNKINSIYDNFQKLDWPQDNLFKKRKELLKNHIGEFHYNNLRSTIKNLKDIQKGKTYFSQESLWDLYFFEKSLVLEYLEHLQAPVLDNEIIREIKNE